MKKHLLIMLFAMVSLFGTSQRIVNSYNFEIGRWSDYLQKWVWTPKRQCDVSFTMEMDIIIADYKNDLRSYRTYKTLDFNNEEISWYSLDDDEQECLVYVSSKEKNNYVMVVYPEVCYKYILY